MKSILSSPVQFTPQRTRPVQGVRMQQPCPVHGRRSPGRRYQSPSRARRAAGVKGGSPGLRKRSPRRHMRMRTRSRSPVRRVLRSSPRSPHRHVRMQQNGMGPVSHKQMPMRPNPAVRGQFVGSPRNMPRNMPHNMPSHVMCQR
jgi:hypothetical protein